MSSSCIDINHHFTDHTHTSHILSYRAGTFIPSNTPRQKKNCKGGSRIGLLASSVAAGPAEAEEKNKNKTEPTGPGIRTNTTPCHHHRHIGTQRPSHLYSVAHGILILAHSVIQAAAHSVSYPMQ